ncbi:MAG: hypothetical protein IPL25_11975 [Saprospiraceae bacterium]|nr:hypothetical protein [Candidatus Vicinibacter affinis]
MLATISDRKRLGRVPVGSSGIGIFAHLITAQDYYPFGSPMAGRTYKSSTNYRFGFNGIEKEDEINGAGNSYAFEYRMYDPRFRMFLSVDPFYKLIHSYSPYILRLIRLFNLLILKAYSLLSLFVIGVIILL